MVLDGLAATRCGVARFGLGAWRVFSERLRLQPADGAEIDGKGTDHTALHSHAQPETAAVHIPADRRLVRDREALQTVTGACSTCSSYTVPVRL